MQMPTNWDEEPIHDPVALKKSNEIDAWLQQENAKTLAERCSLLILAPEESDAFRQEVFANLGSQILLNSQSTTCEVSTLPLGRKQLSKKHLLGIRPQLVLYTIDLNDEQDVLHSLKRALSHFLLVCRNFQLDSSSRIVVMVKHHASLDCKETELPNTFATLFPTLLSKGNTLENAVKAEFVAAAAFGSQVTKESVCVRVLRPSKKKGNDDLILGWINHAYYSLMSMEGSDDDNDDDDDNQFHDALAFSSGNKEFERKTTWGVWLLMAFFIVLVAMGLMFPDAP